MSDYILYDERGVFEENEATILEAFQANNDEDAFRHAVNQWGEYGWALHDDDGLIAWSSPNRKSVVRWFYPWGESRQYSYNGKRQKLVLQKKDKKRT